MTPTTCTLRRDFVSVFFAVSVFAEQLLAHADTRDVQPLMCGVGDLHCPAGEELSLLQVQVRPRTKITDAGVPIYNHLPHRGFVGTQGDMSMLEANRRTDWVLKFKPYTREGTLNNICRATGDRPARECYGRADFDGRWFLSLRAFDAELDQILAETSQVDYIEANAPTSVIQDYAETQLVPDYDVPWGLDRIDAAQGMDGAYDERASAGSGAHVYVFGTGVNRWHQDFGGRASSTLQVLGHGVEICNWAYPDCALDHNGQSTHLAATVAGSSFGVAKSARLHSVKVLADTGRGDLFWVLEALGWLHKFRSGNLEQPAVFVMGFEAPGIFRFMREALAVSAQKGVTVVVAAGNGAKIACGLTPAGMDEVITVAASTREDARAVVENSLASWSSNFGHCVDIYAPGVDIPSAGHASSVQLVTASGTAMAAAHVAGAVAIILGDSPQLKPAEVKQQLLSQATVDAVRNAQTEHSTPDVLLRVPITYTMTADPAYTHLEEGRRCRFIEELWDVTSLNACKARCLSTAWCKFVAFGTTAEGQVVCDAYKRCDEVVDTAFQTWKKVTGHSLAGEASWLFQRRAVGNASTRADADDDESRAQ